VLKEVASFHGADVCGMSLTWAVALNSR